MKISYEGCIPEIAENLRKGEATFVNHIFGEEIGKGYVIGYVMNNSSDRLPYALRDIETGEVYWTAEDRIQIIKTETRVKSKAEILEILQDDGYRVDEGGNWGNESTDIVFNSEMFEDCGGVPPDGWDWLPEWLEEVEVEVEVEPSVECKKEVRVKSKAEILEILQDDGYRVDEEGYWRKWRSLKFNPRMFDHCGEVPTDEWTWLPEWLEEVEL